MTKTHENEKSPRDERSETCDVGLDPCTACGTQLVWTCPNAHSSCVFQTCGLAPTPDIASRAHQTTRFSSWLIAPHALPQPRPGDATAIELLLGLGRRGGALGGRQDRPELGQQPEGLARVGLGGAVGLTLGPPRVRAAGVLDAVELRALARVTARARARVRAQVGLRVGVRVRVRG